MATRIARTLMTGLWLALFAALFHLQAQVVKSVHPAALSPLRASDDPHPALEDTSGEGSQGIIAVSAMKLEGYVHMAVQEDTPVAQVLVEECDADWDRVLGSTHTDYYGHFVLKPARGRKVHLLRLTAKGFRPATYAVTLSPQAAPELKLKLELSSNSSDVPQQRKIPQLSFAWLESDSAGNG